jgi:hypothetical protein
LEYVGVIQGVRIPQVGGILISGGDNSEYMRLSNVRFENLTGDRGGALSVVGQVK